ncbi:MAG TPA: hypothetical protein PKK06_15330 [Phycisphaerae bacterium]|nr:hypothetical protein [Phycisphaerae bacterium]HNU46737.1 hypothetical protein [Phycisphaerae bacterium]
MSIGPINVARVSQNLRFTTTLAALQNNQLSTLVQQSRIAAGRNFVTMQEDPAGATRALSLERVYQQQNQFVQNLQHADNVLAAADDAIGEISTLITEASTIALQNIDSITSPAERESEANLVAGIRAQLMMVGNRQLDGRYIFAGQQTTTVPFVDALGGVAYLGDTGDLTVRADLNQTEIVNVPGNVLFGALSSRIASTADLTPAVSAATRLGDLRELDATQVRASQLVIQQAGGLRFSVDLSQADTLGDVADLITAAAEAAGSSLTVGVVDTGLELNAGSAAVTVTDTGTGRIAAALGIAVSAETSGTITGETLSPRVTRLTPVVALARGAGLDFTSGLTITNGPRSVTIDLSDAQTVQDMINRINNSGACVLARVNDEGTGIDLFNQVSGTALSVGENGGTTAADLGLRTLERATPLATLNDGLGITLDDRGDDLEITAQNGRSFTVNLEGAVTLGEVLDLFNAAAEAAGVDVTAQLAAAGNGVALVDGTTGSGRLAARSVGLSAAAEGLGIAGMAAEGESTINGADVNPTRTEGVFDVLIDLEAALRADDTQAISRAATRLDDLLVEVTRTHGIIGARGQNMQRQLAQMQDAASGTQVSLSEVMDLDYTEAVRRLAAAQTQLQGALQTAPEVLGLSLLDFLS